jgi:ABC-type branched-subunit amino acid transport system ATPase component
MFVIVRSPFGAALLAVRENRQRASAVGLNVKLYELAVFTIAALFAGVAGGLYAVYDLQAYPALMFWSNNAKPVVITLLGGTGSFLGPVVGALIYTYIENAVGKRFPFQFDIILGAIVLLIVLIAPGGFISLPGTLWRLRNRFRGAEVETSGDAIVALEVERAVHSAAVSVEQAPVGDVLLQLEGVSKSFGGLRAVDGVNLEIRAGDRHAIIGPNGAGKSTLFNLITGVTRPDSGRIIFAGRNIAGRPAHSIARAGIGRAFQITNIFPRLTVRQNLQFSMLAYRGITVRPFGIADRRFRGEAVELLESVGLGAHADLPAGQLSHGDQRALELAISIALGSRLLLLDEPTAGMSPYETGKAMELVRRLAAERGLTLLFCEHDMEVVFETARTVTVMHFGRVLVQGSPDEIKRNPDVQKVYLGELGVEESA